MKVTKKQKVKPKGKLEFVAVPIVADNPRFGWCIVGRDGFTSEKKAIEAIKRIGFHGRDFD